MNCPKCESQLHFYESCEGRHGLVTYMSFRCTMCPWETCITDPGAPSSTILNTRAVFGSRLCGLGTTGIDAICGMLGIPLPFTKNSYDAAAVHIWNILAETADIQPKGAARNLKIELGHDPDDVVDIVVTCECTWSKEGFTAAYGVALVISWKNGEVPDCEVLRKCCSACSHWDERDKNSDEYEKWYEGHKDHCSLNHVGSFPAMESEGVCRLWERSVSRLGLQYTQVICDGDSKAFATVRNAATYGDKQVMSMSVWGMSRSVWGSISEI